MSRIDTSFLAQPAVPPMSSLAHLAKTGASSPYQQKVEKAAKDFESVLLQKILDEMRKTVPESGLFEDSTTEQTEAIFWMQLSQELGRQGGLGLWKQLAKQMQGLSPAAAPEASTPQAPETEVLP